MVRRSKLKTFVKDMRSHEYKITMIILIILIIMIIFVKLHYENKCNSEKNYIPMLFCGNEVLCRGGTFAYQIPQPLNIRH